MQREDSGEKISGTEKENIRKSENTRKQVPISTTESSQKPNDIAPIFSNGAIARSL